MVVKTSIEFVFHKKKGIKKMDYADKLDMMDDDCDIQGFPNNNEVETSEKVYGRMLNRFEQLAGYIPDDNSETGIKLRILAEEISDIYDSLNELS